MPATAKAQKKFVLKTVVESIKAKHPAIEIEADGKTFSILPPQLWTDDIIAVGDEPIAASKMLLGPQYDDWIAAGGSSAILMHVIAEAQGVDEAGESSAS